MHLKLHQRCSEHIKEYVVHSEHRTWGSWAGICGAVASAALVAAAAPASGLLLGVSAAAAAAVVALRAFQVFSESLVVLEGVGVLLMTQRTWGGQTRQFLDAADIHSVFIHETLTTTNIHTHLAFLLHNSNQLAVAFPTLSPKLDVLVPLYRELQQQLCLAGPLED